ncbi:insulin-like growth factor-binding protein complex acid labile subunit [Spodoptera frugiperda]|uniref:Insulin-like growth factor-binding protein complex acid labile subunit n=1 Tax=Spodoptera frugiperda TaxID=7108 RepID=A0A2H1W6Z7_SPOFR|nr:insulin-like growth factor-binding protein complex acid labile subunit [Spodoptera frugiperda]XP_035431969.1 insulin-like growth factor-binding protein complex acid labile subunit [Spodoptera frugiperda]XP_035431970.1 insulin-like growth factor-binding protein complex acid labile subunit [Spodoptera frugiperda]XP_035431971.1 insulin-like growth factor-binding protein complex acid labile subunit [Spodoptera frugiperda]XP_035431973.1 insulin-like growth factor-binding protein complex acid labi
MAPALRLRWVLRWLLTATAWGALFGGGRAHTPSLSPALTPPCPTHCICLSQSQVVCNSATLRGVPSALSASVTQLSLSRADLRVLRSDAFAHLRQLRRLALDACNLTRIRPFAFRGLPRLRELYIQHTPLATVDAFAFAALQNISSIVLTHNRIAQIEGYAFAGTNFIKLISLRNNPIKRILAHAFSGLNDVAQIELPSGIRSIEPQAFAGLEGVGVLELAYMDLPAVLSDTFRGLVRVGRLALRESDLGIVRVGAFDGLQRVDTLEICNNKIDGIEELSLVQNNSVTTFKLTGNHMLETPEAVILEVENIVIRGNHVPCECGRDPLSNPLALTPDFPEENFCISPLKVRGRTLGSVSAGSAGCRGEAGGSARARAAGAGARPRDAFSSPQLALTAATLVFLASS